jgi:hypothetical protein
MPAGGKAVGDVWDPCLENPAQETTPRTQQSHSHVDVRFYT